MWDCVGHIEKKSDLTVQKRWTIVQFELNDLNKNVLRILNKDLMCSYTVSH